MRKNVALATGHTIQHTNVINGSWIGTSGVATWKQIIIGTQLDTDEIQAAIEANYDAYGVSDPNTTLGSNQRMKIHSKVLNHVSTITGFNSATTKVLITVYPLLPRADIYTGDDPLTRIALSREGDLDGAAFPATSEMEYTDPRFTPFMAPQVTAVYKILKPRVFAVHGGGKFNIKVRHSYDIVNSTANGPPALIGKKGNYRPLLIKIVGELGVVSDAAGDYVRNLPVSCVWKNSIFWAAHHSQENRIIFSDNNLSRNFAVGVPTAEKFINEEVLHDDQQTEIFPSSFV